MTNWKELGEVPDSDDEDLDDFESQEIQLPAPPIDDVPPVDDTHAPADDVNIWDVPESSPPELPTARFLTKSKPPPATTEQPRPSTPPRANSPEALPSSHDKTERSRFVIELQTSANHSFPRDDASASYRVTTPPPLSSPLSSPLSVREISPEPPEPSPRPPPPARPPQARPPQIEKASTIIDDDAEIARQTGVLLERSLRPRKPIQQHPYLLENAQYTTFMKSHGVKPIKVALPAESARKTGEEEDSQEQDYVEEETQNVSGRLTEDTPTMFDDDLAPSPSLPRTSPPTSHRLRTSSQPPGADTTPMSSISDDELPSLEDLLQNPANPRIRSLKRQSSQLMSSRRKRRTVLASSSPPRLNIPPYDIWSLSSSPLNSPVQHQEASQLLGNTSPTSVRPKPTASVPISGPPSPSIRRIGGATAPTLIEEDDADDRTQSESESESGSSASESDVVKQTSKRIRGVLPASWLRLDQKTNKNIIRNARRSPEPGPVSVPVPRRGVALPKQSTQKPPTATQFPFADDDSSDEEPAREPIREPIQAPSSPPPAPSFAIYEDDDGASVVEEDWIDRMAPGRKRRSQSPGALRGPKRQKKNNLFGDRTAKPRQPRITEVLSRSKSASAKTSSKSTSSKRQRKENSRDSSKHNQRKRAATPPRLSILDVMEPRAPNFIKVAARAARKKTNLGRTSPHKKMIMLATRADNVDALSSLRDWKSGKTRQKAIVPSPRQRKEPRSRPALEEASSNPKSQSPQSSYQAVRPAPRKFVRQSRLDGFVQVDSHGRPGSTPGPSATKPTKRKSHHARAPAFHPAQLETDEIRLDRSHLRAHKRSIDAFYQSRSIAPSVSSLDPSPSALYAAIAKQPRRDHVDARAPNDEVPSEPTRPKVKPRIRRKAQVPRRVDIEAPRFAHANDPLPVEVNLVEEVEEAQPQPQPQLRDKLRGLGEFGTQYTHHFEVFPLDQGVYFHENTLLGRGSVHKALDPNLPDKIRHTRPSVSFLLDKHNLRWGTWDDQTSSELGILVDWIAEDLSPEASVEDPTLSATSAADFVLRYILDAYHVRDDEAETAFLSRSFEVFSGFLGRLEALDWTNSPGRLKRTQLEVSTRFSLATAALRSLSSRHDPMMSFRFENMLKKLASLTIRGLLSCGLDDIRTLYGDLQQLSFRERGIRADQYVANCWVVIIRILQSANIPRSSFWDVAQAIMISPAINSSNDAQFFEGLWRDLFTLLPLGEVDNDGVLVPGLRKELPLEGWSLPQRLIKRVFDLYKTKVRQPTGFNEYCRALVARCHFLVQQWGWYNKCTAIIGTIFDFFGSENLANLRNEEVYQSPRFLEELSRGPCLAIEPTDRCFHIFIKVLALTIQRLKQLERHNDIRNLVARTLPNHDRQHLKEDTVHQRDLAALRNHHDLLCTLFWAAPPDLRPALHLIEKLVIPASAHKEACLINIRAWSQLARFIISSDEDVATFRPFILWSNNVFNQVLDQYHSAASDIEQQFRALASEVRGISTEIRDEMIAKNRATALDVLHSLVKASLDVLKQADRFEAMMAALHVSQLQKVFTSLDFQAAGFDWGLLKVALEMVEYFFGRVDQASEEQYSTGLGDVIDTQQVDDAVLLFNEKLAKDFFWMTRTTINLSVKAASRKLTAHILCTERAVTLAGRIASRFIKDGLTQLSPYFTPGKYALFLNPPASLSPSESPYFPLFLATLLKNYIFDYKDLHTSTLGLWLLCLVKPFRLLRYENYLASVLKKHNLEFIRSAPVNDTQDPDYSSNLDLFTVAIRHMRHKLRNSDDAKHLRAEYAHNLQAVMNRIKDDLALVKQDKAEHVAYIEFVRNIISLIKSHGVNICVVDPFFTQPGPDYSPPLQDPMLHTAGIVAYGFRIGEGDVRAVPQLFHYLFNNFKIVLGNGRLREEREILVSAMRSETAVVSFVLEFMIPAVVKACAEVSDVWLLLDVYVGALVDVLGPGLVPRWVSEKDVERCGGVLGDGSEAGVMSRELGEADMHRCGVVLEGVLAWFAKLRQIGERELCILGLLMTAVDAVRPSIRSGLYYEDEQGNVAEAVKKMARFVEEIKPQTGRDVTLDMFAGLEEVARAPDPKVSEFARIIATDVKKNWVVTAGKVTVLMAPGRMGTQTSTQSGQGTKYRPWDRAALLQKWWETVGRWDLELTIPRKERGRPMGRRVHVDDFMFF
ncbi:hypothetical protein OQA88_12243 [Cercophora sp. LCS_1]